MIRFKEETTLVSFIRKYIFGEKSKTVTAPHIFLVLCFYAAFTTVYAYVLFDVNEMLMRLVLGSFIIASQIICERSRMSVSVAAFLVPTLILSAIYYGVIRSGDVLVFIYVIGASMISLTYLRSKSLLLYLGYSTLVSSILVFGFQINMLGNPYTFTHNAIYLVVSIALGLLVYIFCGSYTQMLDNLVEAEAQTMLAAKAKGNFLARMSHEIRTPLNAIIGLTETQLRKNLPDDAKGALNKIQSSGKLLLGIINDILDLSKIESGKFDLIPEEYVVGDILYDIVNLNMVRIGQKPLRFVLAVDPSVPSRLIGDGLRIKQLLNNLLSNAFKYTNEGSVTLKLAWLPEEGRARLIFSVSDTGSGIRPEELETLFSEYAQANKQANKAIEGTGLGLSITKWLAELMGGSIRAESEFGVGSVFTAEVCQDIADPAPLGEEKAAALANFTYVPETQEEEFAFVPMPYGKVLIVDDVEINLIVAEELMKPYEMHIDCAPSGPAAIEKVRAENPEYDLIFMDHMMPGMDGIEAVAEIRAIGTEYAERVPIAALSANAIAGSEKMFLEHGFQDFLAKPIEPAKLDAILRKWVMRA